MFNLPAKPSIELKEKKPDARRFAVMPLRAANDKRLTRGDYVNLLVLCSYCSQGGYTFAAVSTMGKFRGVSPQAISKGIIRLVKFGYVEQIRKGFTGLRGSLKRVIYDDTLTIDDVISISNTPIERPTKEALTMARPRKQNKQTTNNSVDDTAISFNDALLAVSQSLKTDSDLLTLERLVYQGITLSQLKAAYNIV